MENLSYNRAVNKALTAIFLAFYAMIYQTFKGEDDEKIFMFAYAFSTFFDFSIV
jgi:hypothetical protein